MWQEDHLENGVQPGERGRTGPHEQVHYTCRQVSQEHRAQTEQIRGRTPEHEQAYRAFVLTDKFISSAPRETQLL